MKATIKVNFNKNFNKSFFKLFMNSINGKCMENVKKGSMLRLLTTLNTILDV